MLVTQRNPASEATIFFQEKVPFKKGDVLLGVRIIRFEFRLTLIYGLSLGVNHLLNGFSRGVPLQWKYSLT